MGCLTHHGPPPAPHPPQEVQQTSPCRTEIRNSRGPTRGPVPRCAVVGRGCSRRCGQQQECGPNDGTSRGSWAWRQRTSTMSWTGLPGSYGRPTAPVTGSGTSRRCTDRRPLRSARPFTGGLFDDGVRMDRFDTFFGNRYFDAYDAWRRDRSGPRCWREAFGLLDDADTIIVQHLILGVNAHINSTWPSPPRGPAQARPSTRYGATFC